MNDLKVKSSELNVEEVVLELKVLFKRHYNTILHIYQHFSILSPGMSGYGTGSTCIHQSSYIKFLKEILSEDELLSDVTFQELVR